MTMSRAPTTDAEALADKLIGMVGFEEAERLIKARKPKKKRGRHSYEAMDIVLIWLAVRLREEWIERLGSSPRGRRLPTRHALATKIVDLFWEDHDSTKHLRKFSGLRKGLKSFGADDKETVVKRLLDRDAIHWEPPLSDDEYLEEFKDFPEWESVRRAQARKAERAKGSVGRVGLFEAVHRERPDLRLLPGKSFG
jgi:hypothetical protein